MARLTSRTRAGHCTVTLAVLVWLGLGVTRSSAVQQLNLASTGTATQSATLNWHKDNGAGESYLWTADLALDGIIPTQKPSSPSAGCSGAEVATGHPWAWWRLDLGATYSIARVVVVGGPHDPPVQLRGFRLHVLDSATIPIDQSGLVYTNNVTREDYKTKTGHFQITPNPDSVGRYVFIDLPDTYNRGHVLPLVLCEVNVYIVCPSHTYGMNCTGTCGKCFGDTQCGATDGRCAGGCAAGYSPPMCNTVCTDRTYGRDCLESCGHCKDNDVCDKTNGSCPRGCAAAYHGPTCTQKCFSGTFGENCVQRCHCSSGTSCNIRTGICPNGTCEFGWAGETCSIDLNLIHKIRRNVTATMSDVTYLDWAADKAIDEIQQYNPGPCHCCSSTTPADNNAWWQLDLGGVYLLNFLVVYGRSDVPRNKDQFRGFSVNISNSTMEDTGGGVQIYTMSTTRNTTYDVKIPISPPRLLQYVNINRQKWILTICEVQLYEGHCPRETYGDKCARSCHCYHSTACAKVSGMCPDGCQPGWTDTACDRECGDGTFGLDCNRTCHCSRLNETCNKVSGKCPGDCEAGYHGDTCENECDDGNFGIGCNHSCHCSQDGDMCNKSSGMCPGTCEAGYQMDTCEHECKDRTFGIDLQINSQHGKTCNKSSGMCPGACEAGYQGPTCQYECNDGTYGINCNGTCHCSSMDGTCNKSLGICPGACEAGYQGSTCEHECKDGTFGTNCNGTCHCSQQGNTCNKSSGMCPGACEIGYQGPTCEDVCTNKTYGINCKHTCGHCLNGEQCHTRTGNCSSGCERLYSGVGCIKYEPLESDDGTPAGAIGGAVGGILVILVAVVVAIVILKRRRRKAGNKGAPTSRFNGVAETNVDISEKAPIHPPPKPKPTQKPTQGYVNQAVNVADEIPVNGYYEFADREDDIKVCQLYDYIQKEKQKQCESFYAEFKTLKGGLEYGYDMSQLEQNRGKNRYRDMYAYDHSRVHLEVTEPGETDYINACHIDGYEKVKKFIASQGPTNNMVEDFWRMVLQQKANIIVMLTNVIEMGQPKCIQYWPEEDEIQFGKMTIKQIKSVKYPDYVIRTLELKRNQKPGHRVTQFHFKAWPDKDVPDNAWSLVNFWRVVSKTDASTAPVIVHCSAGVGRTGTFIALDMLYSMAREEGVVRPLPVVEGLRRQRVNMVQTKEQYVYLHEVVAEALCFGTQSVPTSQFEETYRFMKKEQDDNTHRPMLELQYDLILESLVESRQPETDSEPEYSNVALEIDAYRPKSMPGHAANGRDIGAYYLPNHKGNNTYIAAQSPSKATLEEFWTLIAENNIKTVVMLTSQSDESYSLSQTLGAKDTTNIGPYVVNYLNERQVSHFHEACFTFRKQEEDDEDLATVKQFVLRGWRDRDVVPGDPQSVLDILDAVERWQPHVSEGQPVLFHCRTGAKRSGLWCVLMCELQRMKQDSSVNILGTVKNMKTRNSQLVPNYEQYKFCHDVILMNLAEDGVYQNVHI